MRTNLVLYATYLLILLAMFGLREAKDYQPTNGQQAAESVPPSRTIAFAGLDRPGELAFVTSANDLYLPAEDKVWSYTADGQKLAKFPDFYRFLCATQSGKALITRGSELLEVTTTGETVWKMMLPKSAHQAVCSQALFYVIDTENQTALYAISSSGKIVWQSDDLFHQGTVNPKPVDSFTIDSDGMIYVGTKFGGLAALDPKGKAVWQNNLMSWGDSLPVPDSKGRIYRTDITHLVAIDRKGGAVLWRYEIPVEKLSAALDGLPVLSPDGRICFARASFFCIAENGKSQWRFDPDSSLEKFVAPPIFDKHGSAYLYSQAEEHGRLYAVSADGKKKWSYDLGKTLFEDQPMKFGPDGWLWKSTKNGFLAFDFDHR
jgi:outer membrane protein assembly factor BamB